MADYYILVIMLHGGMITIMKLFKLTNVNHKQVDKLIQVCIIHIDF